jgi:7-cyano-7-deazaguanine synthase
MSFSSIVTYSGGLDSTCLLYKVVQEDYIHRGKGVLAIAFNYGQRHVLELKMAQENCNRLGVPLKVLDITFMKEILSVSSLVNKDMVIPHVKDVLGDAQPSYHIPNRNMMLLSIAVATAESVGATDVYYGAAEVDTHSGHWDGSLDFLKTINELIGLNRKHKIEIKAPYITFSKKQIIEDGIKNDVDFERTHTCYNGGEIACGTCSACSSRIQGFLEAGIKDPVPYAIEIPWIKGF